MTKARPIHPIEKPTARRKTLELLAGADLGAVDEILLGAVLDPHPGVGERACDVLLYRYPWLILGTGASEAVAAKRWKHYRFGGAWRRLRDAASALVQTLRPGPMPHLQRFCRLPGLVPELAEELLAAGRTIDAAKLVRRLSGASRKHPPRRQILLAPTYACNLNCPYCYVKGWHGRMHGHMTLDAFRTAVTWSREQGINWMILGGGESTVHPAFPELVQEAWRAGIQVSLTSNGLFGPSVRAAIRSPAVPEFICHVEQDILLHDRARTALLRHNLAAATAAGVQVRIRYTLTPRSDRKEMAEMLGFARSCSIEMVNYGFAFRNMDATNESYRYGTQRSTEFERTLNELMDHAREHGIALHLSKPFPLCQVTIETLRRMLREGGMRNACSASQRGFSMNLTVNPDLTTLPCNAIGLRGPRLTEFKTLSQAGEHYAGFLRGLYRRPWQPGCADCVLHHRGICQGACLAEHYSAQPHQGTGNGEGP